jgi:hypothetical protein
MKQNLGMQGLLSNKNSIPSGIGLINNNMLPSSNISGLLGVSKI